MPILDKNGNQIQHKKTIFNIDSDIAVKVLQKALAKEIERAEKFEELFMPPRIINQFGERYPNQKFKGDGYGTVKVEVAPLWK